MMVINTPTLEDYKEVVEWAIDQNMRWNSGSRFINEDFWESSKTCIVIREGTLTYCDREYIIDNYDNDIFSMERFRENIRKSFRNKFGKKYGLR